MKINIEIEPTTKKEKLVEQILKIKDYVNGINVPDNPFGYIKASPLAISILIKNLGVKPIVHIRTVDRNILAIKSEIYGGLLFDINDFLLVRGDLPNIKDLERFNNFKLEKVLEYLKNDDKIKKTKIGLPLIYFNKYNKVIEKRINSKADFFVTLQVENLNEIDENLIKKIKKNKKELHVYYILTSKNNKDLLFNLGLIKSLRIKNEDKHYESIKQFEEFVDTIIISCPKDFNFLFNFLKKYKLR